MAFSKYCLNCRRTVKRVSLLMFRSSVENNLLLKRSYIMQIIFRINSVSVVIYLFLKKSVVLLFLCGFYEVLQENSFKFQYSRKQLSVSFCKCTAVVLTPQRIHNLSFQNLLGKYSKLRQRISHTSNFENLLVKATEKNIHTCLNYVLIMNKKPFSVTGMLNCLGVQGGSAIL